MLSRGAVIRSSRKGATRRRADAPFRTPHGLKAAQERARRRIFEIDRRADPAIGRLGEQRKQQAEHDSRLRFAAESPTIGFGNEGSSGGALALSRTVISENVSLLFSFAASPPLFRAR